MGIIKVAFATGIFSEFGNKGSLPWQGHPHQKEDFIAFKAFTKDCVIVMGKHTFASLPCLLPTRIHYVLGREKVKAKNGAIADAYITSPDIDLNSLCRSLAKHHDKDVVIIGGAGLVRKGLDFADETMYTQFHNRTGYKHDVSMPLLPKYMGEVIAIESHGSNESYMNITHYRRKR
jgi:dihydrofolate reductase